MELKYRKDVPVELTWDLSLIYDNDEMALADMAALDKLANEIKAKYEGKIANAKDINDCLDAYREIALKTTWVSCYTDLSVSVDYYDAKAKELNEKVNALLADVAARLAFIDSEILSLDEKIIAEAIDQSKDNKGYLRNLLRQKPHRLSKDNEEVLSALSNTLNSFYNIYNTCKLADIRFDSFEANGKSYPLAYSLFEDNYEYEKNAEVRRAAFKSFYQKIKEYENTTAVNYNCQVQMEKQMAKIRGFDSVFDYLLYSQEIDRAYYDGHIDTIMEKLAPHMRKYAKLKQRIHKLDKMTYADLKISDDPDYDPSVTIEKSKDYIKEGLTILGEEYGKGIDRAYAERWVDFANNLGKSTGGFCCFVPHKNCYVLLNWNNKMADVFTLAHELGHCMNAMLSDKEHEIFDAQPHSFFGEGPSTTNEIIMASHLFKNSDDKRFRRWILSNIVSKTYYHNFVTHFLEAYYQREVYRIIDKGGSVNAPMLSRIFRETLEKFWGDAVEIAEGAELTWMRQPHYYMGLYPYQYSAGLSLGTQMASRLENDSTAIDGWMKFLKSGCTLDPKQVGELLGVDVFDLRTLESTIEYIGSLIDEIEKLTDELGL